MRKLFLLLLMGAVTLQACKKDDDNPTDPGNNNNNPPVTEAKQYEIVELNTTFGNIYIWLFDATPKHKANFLELSRTGYYSGTTFHRIIDNFMIQGGDPNSKDSNPANDGLGGPGYTIEAEFVDSIKHDMGMVAAARQGDAVNPERRSSGSQFYIVEAEKGAHHLDGAYTIFGKTIGGMDVVHEIAVQPKDGKDRPLTNITMQATVVKKTAAELKEQFNFVVPE